MTGYEGLITQLLEDPAHNAMKAAAVIRLLVKDTFRWKEAAHDISDEGEWVLWKDIAQAKEHLRTEAARAEVSELSKTISQIWLQLGNPTYEELNGRSIHDLIDEIKAENKKLRETLEMAEQSVLFAKANNEWRSEDKEDFDFVIEAIRKLKGEKDD
jgi:hypothetical protein